MEVGLSPGHIVLDGYPAPPAKGHSPPPICGLCLLWPNGWMDQDATWYGCRPQPRRHCVRWGPSSPLAKRGHSTPTFGSYCGKTAGWIKIPLGTGVGLGPGHIVVDGDPLPPERGTAAPTVFGPCLLWPNGRPCELLLSTCFTLICFLSYIQLAYSNYHNSFEALCRQHVCVSL